MLSKKFRLLAILAVVSAFVLLPAAALAEDKVYTNDEYNLTLAYPDTYSISDDIYEPFIFIVQGPKRLPAMHLAVIDKQDSVEAAVNYVIEETGGSDINIVSTEEITLKDAKNTKATRYVLEYLAMGQYELKGVGVIVPQGDKQVFLQVTFAKQGFEKYAETFTNRLYNLKFK